MFVSLKLPTKAALSKLFLQCKALRGFFLKEANYNFQHSWLYFIFVLNQLAYMRGNFSVIALRELKWEVKRAFDRYRYFFKKHVYT
uniref:Uncharacterized mitochondrial protein ORF15 n=1 Tax=Paramecium tetraurelia TaxID=5888 RepID=YM15_PARTE